MLKEKPAVTEKQTKNKFENYINTNPQVLQYRQLWTMKLCFQVRLTSLPVLGSFKDWKVLLSHEALQKKCSVRVKHQSLTPSLLKIRSYRIFA